MDQAVFDKKTYEKDGLKLVYYTAGHGQPVVFFHGGGGSALTYDDILLKLSKKYLIIASDIPCFGDSDVPEAVWDLDDYGDYFKSFFEALNLRDVVVMGHSFGGGVAMAVANHNPRVLKMVLVDSIGYPPDCSFENLLRTVVASTANYANGHRDPKNVAYLAKSCLKGVRHRLPKIKHVLDICYKVIYQNYLQKVELDIPILVLWAKSDATLPPSTASHFEKTLPTARVKMVAGHHGWLLENPEDFVEEVERFIEDR